ncbi:glycosyltransferase family 2 protein [Paraburkholderia sp. A1BS-2L]|uniref:glycosyltransferase family 2 protein n=1 Tax=Paraburkholderia sp. A1BS-2L TaxID=3028373 RepID=UPI003DA9F454
MDASVVGDAGTGTVVVFYRPDAGCVARANRLASLGPCVVVDNTEQVYDPAALGLDPRVYYLPNGANLGIATAINQGVEALIACGCTSAILFDQDSEASDELLRTLPLTLKSELERGTKVALIGPAYEDGRLGGIAPFVRFGMWRLKRVAPVGTCPVEVDFLITSGSCINLAAWSAIGPMDDALFIDFVDLEWCIRARWKGYKVLGVPWIVMRHTLGDEPVRLFGRPYPMHSPVRHYYLFRNAVTLVRRSYVPWTWKSTELIKLPVRLLVYACLPQERTAHLRMALRGLYDGLRGRLGHL